MNGMGGSEVGSGGTYVKILNGEALHGASGAVRGMDGHGVLVIGAASAIGGVLDGAVRPTVGHDGTESVHANGAIAGPIRGGYNPSRQELWCAEPAVTAA